MRTLFAATLRRIRGRAGTFIGASSTPKSYRASQSFVELPSLGENSLDRYLVRITFPPVFQKF